MKTKWDKWRVDADADADDDDFNKNSEYITAVMV